MDPASAPTPATHGETDGISPPPPSSMAQQQIESAAGGNEEAATSEWTSLAFDEQESGRGAPAAAAASALGGEAGPAVSAAAADGGASASAASASSPSPLYQSDPWSNHQGSYADAAAYYESLDLSFDDIADLADNPGRAAAANSASASSANANDELLYPTCKKNNGKLDAMDSVEESYILGTLIVRVVAARNLSSVDSPGLAQAVGGILFGGKGMGVGGGGGGGTGGGSRRGLGGSSVNPYASVRFGATTQRTSQVFGTPDPMWPRAEAMYLDVVHPPPEAVSSTGGGSSSPRGNVGKDPAESAAGKANQDRLGMSRESPVEESRRAVAEWTSVDPPVLTVGIFHSNADMSLKKHKHGSQGGGDSNDVFLGMATANLTHLLTGKSRFDEWLPLQGGPSSSSSSSSHHHPSVRLVCEYEPSDPPPHQGDTVQFTRFCRPCDLYPVSPIGATFVVEEGCNDSDLVLLQTTSREGWVSSFLAHRFMLLVVDRHYGAMDLYQEEMLSIAQRLSHSPMLSALQESAGRLDSEGMVQVGASVLQGGASLLGRWFQGGLETVVQDLAYATNWDGRFNPDPETSLATGDVASSPTAVSASSGTTAPSSFASQPLSSDVDAGGADASSSSRPALPNMPSCPITQEPMRDPVVAADGHTYERSAIVRWLQTSDKSPLTGSVLPHKNLVPNYMLLSSLQEHAAAASTTIAAAATSESNRAPSILVETVEEESDMEDETTDVQID